MRGIQRDKLFDINFSVICEKKKRRCECTRKEDRAVLYRLLQSWAPSPVVEVDVEEEVEEVEEEVEEEEVLLL
jgi:hypothetical protein